MPVPRGEREWACRKSNAAPVILGVPTRRRVVDHWRLIWPGYRDRSRRVLVRPRRRRVGRRLRGGPRSPRGSFLLYQGGRASRIFSGLRPRDRRFRAQGKTARRPTAAEAGFGGKWLELFRFATAGKRSKTAALCAPLFQARFRVWGVAVETHRHPGLDVSRRSAGSCPSYPAARLPVPRSPRLLPKGLPISLIAQ